MKKTSQISLGLAIVAGAIVLSAILFATRPSPAKVETPVELQRVSVIEASPGTYRSRVASQGNVTPRWITTLTSEVSGQVKAVDNKLLTGASFKQGDTLARIDDLAYIAAVAQAEAAVADARQNVAQEKRLAARAKLDWERGNFKKAPTDLVLRKPQLKAAQAALASAIAQRDKAKQDLDHTLIKAPYDGVVISREINLGSFVQPGSEVARIYSTKAMEVFLPMRETQLAQLDLDALIHQPDNPITLQDTRSNQQWQGKAGRIEQAIDSNNRWRNLIVEINTSHQNHPLMGQFVRAELIGKAVPNLLMLPESSLSRENHIWYIDEENLLQSFPADILFTQQGKLYLTAPDDIFANRDGKPLRIALSPGNNFLKAVEVTPELAADDSSAKAQGNSDG